MHAWRRARVRCRARLTLPKRNADRRAQLAVGRVLAQAGAAARHGAPDALGVRRVTLTARAERLRAQHVDRLGRQRRARHRRGCGRGRGWRRGRRAGHRRGLGSDRRCGRVARGRRRGRMAGVGGVGALQSDDAARVGGGALQSQRVLVTVRCATHLWVQIRSSNEFQFT